ncbi:MAG: adenylyltransferase/cytidyltransferase family protein [Sedimentisphaerales bacterium]
MKKVLVSGCYDLIHAGHIAFFKEASSYGKLYVSVGSDENIRILKGKQPYFNQDERCYIVGSIKYVEEAFIGSGAGLLDFAPDLERIRPDIFIANSDGHTEEKEILCKKHGVRYLVLKRIPEAGLPARSSSHTKKELRFPYRICIAGGWIDQPWMSKICAGSVVVAQIRPTIDFNDRSGMATSSRKVALELWGGKVPEGNPIRNAKLLFGAENPPGTKYVSGSQDQIGLLAPGINRLFYDGDYWPSRIDSVTEPEICNWLSQKLYLVGLRPRPCDYDPLSEMNLREDWVKKLGESGELCWKSILSRNVAGLGKAMKQSFEMWQMLLPDTVPQWVKKETDKYDCYPGYITSGCGGGYLMVASDKPVPGAINIQVNY